MKCARYFLISFLMILEAMPRLASAENCIFIPGKSICGVSLRTNREGFVQALGKPDGTIEMSGDKLGYVYGQRLILIFLHDKLSEIHAWKNLGNFDFRQYISNDTKRTDMQLTFKNWSPWGLTRKETEKHNDDLPILDSDEFSEVRMAASKETVFIHYASCYEDDNDPTCRDLANWKAFKVNYITINLRDK